MINFILILKKAKIKKLKIVTFGFNKNSNIYPISINNNNSYQRVSIKIKDKIFKLNFKNLNIYNVLSSLALLDELNLNFRKIFKNLKNYEPTEGRGKIHYIKRYEKI